MANKKFPSECNPRGVVKPLDKVLIYNSDTGASDEFSTVSQLTKIQDDAIDALDAAKVDKVEGKSLILDNEIARLADVTNQTLDGLGGEATVNKKSTINESETDYPNNKAVFNALTLKIDKTTLGATEEVAATSLVDLRKELDALKEIVNNVVRTYAQIETLSVDTLQINGAPLFLFGTTAPAVVPDFKGQIFIKTTAAEAVWIAIGDSTIGNWKEV